MDYLDKEHIHRKIFDIYQECDIHEFPLDCFSVLEHYGLRIITYQEVKIEKPDLFRAISNYSKDAFRFRMTVYYNALNNIGRIRFSLMHELGHFILGHTKESEINENEADYFASCILAPRVAIKRLNCMTSDDIHKTFGLSYAAANRTLLDYKDWNNSKPSITDNHLQLWIFDKQQYLEMENMRKKLVKRHKRTRKQLKEREGIANMFYGYYQIHAEDILECQKLGIQ